MKIAIYYVSVHRGNTKKLVEGIAKEGKADLIDILKDQNPDLSKYDMIGFVSGVFYRGLHKKMKVCIQNAAICTNQKVFLIVTCGIACRDNTISAEKQLKDKGIPTVGSFPCRVYDTFGPFKKIGGIAKEHPNSFDITKAQEVVKSLI